MKKILSLFLCIATVISLCACTDILSSDKRIYSTEEFSINMPDGFEEKTDIGYDAFYVKDDVYVWAIKDPFSAFDGSVEWTIGEYADLIYTSNSQHFPGQVYTEEGLTLMEYTVFNSSKNKTFTYLTSMYKGSDAFWTVQLVCEKDDFEEYKPYFIEWAKTIKVK